MSTDQIQAIGCVFRPARYRRNQILFFEGGIAQHLFALHSGLVKMVKSLDNGKTALPACCSPASCSAWNHSPMSPIPLPPWPCVTARFARRPREDFATYLRTNPDIAIGMVRFLVGELKRVRTQVTDMSFKDARMKLATFLLSLITTDTPANNGTVNLTLPLSRQEISEVLELSPETISRTLSSFRREQLVMARGRHMVIQNRPGWKAWRIDKPAVRSFPRGFSR